MDENTTISIIIPAYNVENYICNTLQSLENQTHKNFEVILINDGSEDNTLNVIENFIKSSKLDIKLINQENAGVSVARNRGIKEANGTYIYFLDADDYVEHNIIEESSKIILEKNPDLIYFKFDRVTSNGAIYQTYDEYYKIGNYVDGLDCLEDIVTYNTFVGICSSIYKKEVIDKFNVYFDSKHICGEDQEFVMKYLVFSEDVTSINRVLHHYVIRKSSVTNSCNYRRLELFNVLNNIIEYLYTHKPDNEKAMKIIEEIQKYYLPDRIMDVIIILCYNAGKRNEYIQIEEIKKYVKNIRGYACNSLIVSLKNGKISKCLAILAYLISPKCICFFWDLYDRIRGKTKGI
ncbi:glycosyltransferase family A protein [Methanococcus maripaludis]|uniref:Glycosyltransferase involved in cell wall biosynthesis n=2 Tax=Methanococcus maripaludis TaxID=39152 RepID=A0A7J9PI14_METMI|nr:glycosyltransferase family A protein [Methanococcus maripaludis]MBA2862300.1 glycosyltransferase involved in cell wall biosynthesis [Methanococcus maripaludis]